MMPYLTIAGMIVLIMFPIILPALITLVHKITEPKTESHQSHRLPQRQPAAAT